jgi:hypothetical protein
MANASTDDPGSERLHRLLEIYMEKSPEARREAALCLRMEPAVLSIRSCGLCTTLRALREIEPEDLRPYWKNRRSWEVATGAASYLVWLQEENFLPGDLQGEREALAHWAHSARPEEWIKDPIGRLRGVGIATFQYLRMMGGVDTVMPDKIVRGGVKAILEEAHAEMDLEGDIALIEAVRIMAEIAGCRSADICWMCWCLQ